MIYYLKILSIYIILVEIIIFYFYLKMGVSLYIVYNKIFKPNKTRTIGNEIEYLKIFYLIN
jgi:membrane protein insertase Oxa1/YidC/SpoIIIJ